MIFLLAGVMLVGPGCEQAATPASRAFLRVGVMPTQPAAQLQAIYAPLVRHLGTSLGLRAELVLVATHEELEERFGRGEIELAHMSGSSFVLAEKRGRAVPLTMRIIDRHVTSVVIARAGTVGRFPEDFRGRSLLLGARSSACGDQMPRHFFGEMKLLPEAFFASVTHATNHETIVAAVREARVDLGVVNAVWLRQRIAQGSIDAADFCQVWESPPFGSDVWVVPANIPMALRTRISDVFLALDIADPGHETVMAPLGARAFVPATRADFSEVRRVLTGHTDYIAP